MSTENNISRKTRDRLYTGSQWFVYLRVLHNIQIDKHRFDSQKMWVKYRFKNTILNVKQMYFMDVLQILFTYSYLLVTSIVSLVIIIWT